MYPKIFHIWGPLDINSYGTMIALGIVTIFYFLKKDPFRKKIISLEDLINVIACGTLIGFVGGRTLSFISDPSDFDSWVQIITPWVPGFSILGSVLAISLTLPFYLRRKGIPILPFLDLICSYAPLLQAISRIGCFLAGCCYGSKCSLSWAIQYHNQECFAPLGQPLHPTQLYSAFLLFLIFLILQFAVRPFLKKPGQLWMSYLILISLERFIIDFWRGDRQLISGNLSFFSIQQDIALIIFLCSLIGFILLAFLEKEK